MLHIQLFTNLMSSQSSNKGLVYNSGSYISRLSIENITLKSLLKSKTKLCRTKAISITFFMMNSSSVFDNPPLCITLSLNIALFRTR